MSPERRYVPIVHVVGIDSKLMGLAVVGITTSLQRITSVGIECLFRNTAIIMGNYNVVTSLNLSEFFK